MLDFDRQQISSLFTVSGGVFIAWRSWYNDTQKEVKRDAESVQ
jgi:hypothetical protein